LERLVNILEKLKQRRTHKVIGDLNDAVGTSELDYNTIDEMLAACANAPFHYACDRSHKTDMPSVVPWRVYKLNAQDCNKLADFLIKAGDTTKVPNMLTAADYMLQVTWLPDEATIINKAAGKDEEAFKGTVRNMEHIAAASAFIQSLLLAGEEKDLMTYWSSGGALKSDTVFEYLSIPQNQMLLGAVFLFSKQVSHAQIKQGAMRDARGRVEDWSKWCELS
jgi:nitroreductase